MQLSIPKRLGASEASHFCRLLGQHMEAAELILNFTQLAFVVPQGTMCVFVGLVTVINKRIELGLRPVTILRSNPPTDAYNYLANIDFFLHLNGTADIARPIKFPTNKRHIKLSCIELDRTAFLNNSLSFQQSLDEQATKFASFLLQRDADTDPAAQAVGWCLREAVRNVFEHAGVDKAYVTGQAWKTGNVELSVGDAGKGILEALTSSHGPRDACHALELAAQPGITDYTGPETNDRWQNSGFGLYMLSRIAGDFGSLTVVSSGAFLKTERGSPQSIVASSGSNLGTTLALSLDIPSDIYFTNLVDKYAAEGEALASTLPKARRRASAASKSVWS
jgi:hypothetical protein